MVLLAVRGHLSRHDATATRGSTSFRARPRPSMCTDEAAHKRKKTIETSYQVRRRKHVESDPVRQIQKKKNSDGGGGDGRRGTAREHETFFFLPKDLGNFNSVFEKFIFQE
jgi:hypothetical protein